MDKKIFEKVVETPSVIVEKTIEVSGGVISDVANLHPVQKTQEYWKLLGPGLTTGAADDDPSGVATYSQTGAQYGFQLLWLAAFTFPFMAIVQEMCARLGMVTGKGLAANIRQYFPRSVLYICTALLFVANTFNIGADLGAMAKATQLLKPNLDFGFLVLAFGITSLALQIFTTYEKYARYLKYLALILLAYVITAFVMPNFDWKNVAIQGVTPSWHFSKEQILLICAILGTTISPYLFFWQTSQEVEEEILEGQTTIKQRQAETLPKDVRNMRIDVWVGMFFSNLVMFFIIAVTSTTLFSNGITNIATASDAALALRPFAGDKAYLLFAVGIIGTGMLAIPVLAGSSAYAFAESFGWKSGLYRQLRSARAFYGIILFSTVIGFALNFIGLDPIKVLIYSAVANGLIAPIILVLIVTLSSNKKIMGQWVNGPILKMFGWGIVGLMTMAGVATIVSFL
jgi:NRAMP (natural resistance-associated macrophage protein)-like metal ion transporter